MDNQLLPALECRCERCDGMGWLMKYGENLRCNNCNGAGFEPTELGEQVLALVRHNFRPMQEDLRRA